MSTLDDRDAHTELVDLFSAESPPGPVEVEHRSTSGPTFLRWSWLALAASVLLVVGILVQTRGSSRPSTVSARSPSEVSDPQRSAAPAPVAVIDVGHSLLGLTTRWDLIGRGQGVVVRIQLASGRVTVTQLPAESATAPATLLAQPGRVVVVPLIDGRGYLVTDGLPATPLTGRLARPGPVVPGPKSGQVWMRTNSPQHDAQRMTLIGPDGRAGVSVNVPGDGYLSGEVR